MASTQTIAIAIVAVVAVAAVGAFLMLDTTTDDDGLGEVTGRLQVFGNVNNDDFIDDRDLLALDTMKNDWDQDKYPFADANRDGKLDEADKSIIQKIISGKTVKVYYVDGKGDIEDLTIPVKSIGLAGTMTFYTAVALGIEDSIGGITKSSSMDPVAHKSLASKKIIGPKAYEVDMEIISETDIDVVITQYSSTYDDVEEAVEKAGIPCIRLDTDTTTGALNGYLLIGFIAGNAERGHEIATFYDDVLAEIEQKLGTIPEADRKRVMTTYSYSMCGTDYYLTKNTEAGGGINVTDFPENTVKIKDNKDAVRNYPADWIIQYSGWGWGGLEDPKDEFDYYGKYFDMADAYPANYVVINKDLPDLVRSAYVAALLYPEVFGADYGEKVLQDWVDGFYTGMGDYDVRTDGVWIVTSGTAGITA
ncbi:MAG: ABC transporter substrate-binding protein [Candidatus Methanomethylophilaceae archaeon]|nr:ABC transporter substrate-binding protein [Candidatus Methanomethylophilaceae archaeon]